MLVTTEAMRSLFPDSDRTGVQILPALGSQLAFHSWRHRRVWTWVGLRDVNSAVSPSLLESLLSLPKTKRQTTPGSLALPRMLCLLGLSVAHLPQLPCKTSRLLLGTPCFPLQTPSSCSCGFHPCTSLPSTFGAYSVCAPLLPSSIDTKASFAPLCPLF